MNSIYLHHVKVDKNEIDENGHANNIAYLSWFIDSAVAHAGSSGCTKETFRIGATWFIREHRITYLRPVFAGDRITVHTWVSTLNKSQSMRKYIAVRESDRKAVAKCETDWVFVNRETGRPMDIPSIVSDTLPRISGENEPKF